MAVGEMNTFYRNNYYPKEKKYFRWNSYMELIIRHCIDEKCHPQMFYNLYNSIIMSKTIIETIKIVTI